MSQRMHIIYTLLIGLLVGALAKLAMPGRDPGGIIVTIVLGVAGSVLASYLGQALGWYRPGQPSGFIAAIGGALLLLAIYRFVVVRRRAS
jgi:uncharacterized membrane protein YeaQ/YmgE (transglycosylase-associated protein family)